ncbi:MAG: sigma-54-dependent Fis family transcriptional regulator, partial [Deltaproteobacteria bacterium]|nr:sigma-54-dependent Fis family transcriptional regulator [Deltaproteobacteria bacterium]
NVRELENIIRRMVVLRDERAVLSDLSFGGGRGTSSASKDHRNDGAASDRISLKQVTKRTVHEVEKEIILETLKRTRWNRSRAAQELGINYKTLLYKLKRFNI